MFYKRSLLSSLEKEFNKKEIVVITGMRQVGKTTLLEHLYKKSPSTNKVILDAGNPLHRTLFEEENYDNVLHNLNEFGLKASENAFIFIDEIQYMPSISKVIKYLYDHHNIKFFVTGSSSYYLKNLFPESLAGRKIVYEIFPLTFEEFLTFKGIQRNDIYQLSLAKKEKEKNEISYNLYSSYYAEYLKYGGFPGVVLEPDVQRKAKLLEGIFKAYFEIDVRLLADFKELSRFRNLILLLIPRIGTKLDITKLATKIEVSRETVYSYLSFLEQTYFISLIPKFSKSIDKKSAGSKNLYLCDTGLANYLGNLSEGQLLENGVYQNLKPNFDDVAYFSKKSGAEIDFIIDEKFALEVKQSVSKRHIATTKRMTSELNLTAGYVIAKEYSEDSGVILAQDL